jgi:uncharacterized protein DUF4259
MGAWGAGAFENDDASDWVHELEGRPDLGVVRDRLRAVIGAEYVEVPEGAIAVAAAEVVAAALGRPSSSLPEVVSTWVSTVPSVEAADVVLAQSGLARARADGSELAELWTEGDANAWTAALDDLDERLRR